MKNEIKKIILSMKDKKLNGIIVQRENSINTYGYNKDNDEELLDEYSNLVRELKEQYKDELTDLNDQDAVNKLYLLGKLEYSDKNLITKITNYVDADQNPIKFIVTKTNGQEEIKLEDCFDDDDYIVKFKDKLVEMCNTYDIELDSKDDLTDEFIDKLCDIGLFEDKQEGKIVDSEDLVSTKEVPKEILTDAKIKNFVMNHKLLSGLIAAGVIGLILSTHGCGKKAQKNVEVSEVKNNDYQEEQVIDTYDFDDTVINENIYKEELPTVEPIEYFKEIAFENEHYIFPSYIETGKSTLIASEYNGNNYYINDNYYGDKDNLIEIRNENMSNVANYIQSNINIKDKGIYIYHENLFNYDLRDKAFVKYFSMFGNQIIKNAYQNKKYDLVIDNAIRSDEELIRLINDGEPLEAIILGERQDIYYNELSQEAKEMVLNLAWTNNLPLSKNMVLNGYNQDDISNIILEQAEMLNMNK